MYIIKTCSVIKSDIEIPTRDILQIFNNQFYQTSYCFLCI